MPEQEYLLPKKLRKLSILYIKVRMTKNHLLLIINPINSIRMLNAKLNYLLPTLFLFLTLNTNAQKTITPLKDSVFYRFEKGLIQECLRKDAVGYSLKQTFRLDNYIKRIFYLSNNKPLLKCVVRDTFLLGQTRKPEVLITQEVGDCVELYENGQRKRECVFQYGLLNGELRTYNEAGELCLSEKWENGVWKSGVRFVSGLAQIMSNAYQSEPTFKGGEVAFFKYINSEVSNEKLMSRFDIPSKVLINFGINEWGKVEDIKVLNGIVPDFEKTLIKIFEKMPMWNPGYVEGKAAKFRYTIPFRFRNEEVW